MPIEKPWRLLSPTEEPARIFGWRLWELDRAGYGPEAADRIAASKADLHAAVGLKQRGCDDDTALRILL